MKKSFLLYQDWEEIFDSLSDAQAGKLLKGMFDYSKGEIPEFSPRLALIFIPIRQMLGRNKENYENICKVNSKNAKKRWEQAQKDTKEYDRIRPHTTAYDKDKDKDKDKGIRGKTNTSKEDIWNILNRESAKEVARQKRRYGK